MLGPHLLVSSIPCDIDFRFPTSNDTKIPATDCAIPWAGVGWQVKGVELQPRITPN